MQIAKLDIWAVWDTNAADAICITTNGFVRRNGRAVMGRGCAAEAARKFPGIDRILGERIRRCGNRCQILIGQTADHPALVSFPVKPIRRRCVDPLREVVAHMVQKFAPGDTVPGWACKADPRIVHRSALQLCALSDRLGWKRVVLPRPGCGAGELSWSVVEQILQHVLDDRFVVVTRPSQC